MRTALDAARITGRGSDVVTGLLATVIVPDPLRGFRRRAGYAELVAHHHRADAVMRRAGPTLFVGAAATDLAAAVAVAGRDPLQAGLRLASALAVAGCIVLTARVNAPVNHQLRSWSPEVEVDRWRETWRAWERGHLARRSLVAVAAVLAAAASVRRP